MRPPDYSYDYKGDYSAGRLVSAVVRLFTLCTPIMNVRMPDYSSHPRACSQGVVSLTTLKSHDFLALTTRLLFKSQKKRKREKWAGVKDTRARRGHCSPTTQQTESV